MTAQTAPEEFDFAGWFADANLPESSADIFTSAHVLSDLAELQRRIDTETAVADAEVAESDEKELGSKARKSPLQLLEDEYVALAQRFADSKITVYVRALSVTERKNIREAHELAQKNDGEDNGGFIHRILAASIVGLKKAAGDRKPAALTLPQVTDLHARIGDAQIKAIYDAQLTATNGIPTVDADFLRRLSGPESGPES